MSRSTVELEHDGETYEYTIERWVNCVECGAGWSLDTVGERETCPECHERTGRERIDRYQFYSKMVWWFDDPTPDVDLHTEALRNAADRLEALAANGWDMVQADGEHVYFERRVEAEDRGTESEYKISEDLT